MLNAIKTNKEYKDALTRVYDLMQLNLKEESAEFIEYQTLVHLIEIYEQEHYKIAPPHPIEAIKFRMDQMDLTNIQKIKRPNKPTF